MKIANTQSLIVASDLPTEQSEILHHPIPKMESEPTGDQHLYGFKWILSQAILNSRPLGVVTDELFHASPLEIRTAAESVAEPAGYLVVPVSSHAALIENIVNQILARIAVETGDVHTDPVPRKLALKKLQQLVSKPDQRLVVVIQNGEKVPADTFRGLSRALRTVTKTGTKDSDSLPSLVVVIGAERGFFETPKGQSVLSILGENGVFADNDAGIVKRLEDKSSRDPGTDTAWQLTKQRLERDAENTESAEPAVKPENSLVVVDPINHPRSHTSLYRRILSLGAIGSGIGSGLRHLFARHEKKKSSHWLHQATATNTRKTPTFRPPETAAELK